MSELIDREELSHSERRKIETEAKAAGELARLQRAQELLPFEDLRPRARSVAGWLLTLEPFTKHYTMWMKSESKQYPADTIYVMKGNNAIVGTFSARVVDSLEDFAREVATAFCGYSDTDEIRELRVLPWKIKVSCSRDARVGIADKRTFTNKPNRKDRFLNSPTVDVTTAMRNRLGRHKQDEVDIENGPSILEVVNKLGKRKELDRAYLEGYEERFEELKEEILNDTVRNAAIEKKNEKIDKRNARQSDGGSRFSLRRNKG